MTKKKDLAREELELVLRFVETNRHSEFWNKARMVEELSTSIRKFLNNNPQAKI